MPSVTNPLVYDTRQALMEWYFSNANKTAKVVNAKDPYGPQHS